MIRKILLALALGLAANCAQAQTKPKTTSTPPAPSPAQMGVTPTTEPETLQVLDKNKHWATMGSMVDGVFIPVGGGGSGAHTNVVSTCASVILSAGLHAFATINPNGDTCSIIGTEGGGGGPVGASCSASAAFLARTSGLSAKETAAYGNMICGMVSDETWPLLDALYIFATNNTATASLNLVSTNYNGTVNGTLTFARDEGWTGTGAGDFVTGFDPSSAATPNLVRNSANIGVYVLNSRTAAASYYDIGIAASGEASAIAPFFNTAGVQGDLNGSTYPLVYIPTDVQGSWLLDRVTGSQITYYHNGALVATNSGTSAGVPSGFPFFVFSIDQGGSGIDHTHDQISAAWMGGGFTPTQATAFQTRINNYMIEMGINVY